MYIEGIAAAVSWSLIQKEAWLIYKEESKNRVIFNQRMAGYLMQKGFVLLDMRPDMKSPTRKNIFVFKNTPQLRQSIDEYLNQR